MKKNIEVELKFEVIDTGTVENFLEGKNFEHEVRIRDVYLDTRDGQLYQLGIFIRVRDDKKIDFKYNLDDLVDLKTISEHGHCDELTFQHPLQKKHLKAFNNVCQTLQLNTINTPSLEAFKINNNFIESVVIDKKRKVYKDDEYEFSYDIVAGLGRFLEIEVHAGRGDDITQIKASMKRHLKGLDLKLITTGYNELYWRKHNFDLYLAGRYLLQEDYAKYRKGQK